MKNFRAFLIFILFLCYGISYAQPDIPFTDPWTTTSKATFDESKERLTITNDGTTYEYARITVSFPSNINEVYLSADIFLENIVGGVDKGNDYESLIPLVQKNVTTIICLGTDNEKIIETFSDVVDEIIETESAFDAVANGYRLAKKEHTVLLSPACASFDLFESYEDRGKQFKRAVRNL